MVFGNTKSVLYFMHKKILYAVLEAAAILVTSGKEKE